MDFAKTVLLRMNFNEFSPADKAAHIAAINEYVTDVLPELIAKGRSLSRDDIRDFHRGLDLLGAFPQYAIFASNTRAIRGDYPQYIATMEYQFKLLINQILKHYASITPDGERVIVLQQSQSLRRGRPTQAESEQRRREEEQAMQADAVSRLTGVRISTSEPAPIQERESDTSRRKDDGPDLFDAAIQNAIDESSEDDSSSTEEHSSTPSVHTHRGAADGQSALSPTLTNLREWLPVLPAELASRVRSLRDQRAEMASESEKAKLIFEQGGTPEQMQPHTQRAKELQRDINDLYSDIDQYLGGMYLMLTEVNPEWEGLAAKWLKATGEPLEKLTFRMKPYAEKMNAAHDNWLRDTLAACRKDEERRIARETRDPEKEKEMHKMDAYIRRKDVNASPKRLATMQQYRDKLAEMGADADSLAAYDVFINAVAAEVEKQEQGKEKK